MQRKFTMFVFLVVLLMLPLTGWSQTASYDTVSIHDLQYVPNPDSSDRSLYYGDTVVVKGYVMTGVREIYVGARWACYITDGTVDPWSGFFILQNDSFAVNTLFGFVQEGDEVYFTGVVDEYNSGGYGFTQLALLTNPPVPVTVVSVGNTLPGPKVLTTGELSTHATGEQWENMRVKVENVVVTGTAGSNQAIIDDGSGACSIDDYFWYFRSQFNNGLNPWPVAGTQLNLTGFSRDIFEPYFSINPRDDSDIDIQTNPPVITGMYRTPGVPHSSDNVTVKASIVDNGNVQEAKLIYSVDWGPFNEVTMTSGLLSDTFAAAIPMQPNNSYVRYFVWAQDNVGDVSQSPGDTSKSVYSYVIRDGGLSIKDVQYTHGYSGDISPFNHYSVTLEGVVTTDPTDWVNNFYIESKDSAWYGMWVYDPNHAPTKGDWISVTGEVSENYGVTRMQDITDLTVVTPGYGVFDPVLVTTGEIGTGGVNAEAYEDVLIKVVNVTVTNPFPDAPGNYGEFTIDDGSGGVRVDDAFSAFNGNLDSSFALNDVIQELRGVHYYSFSNYKILPRDSNDVIGHTSGIEDQPVPVATNFALEQNYPNPFNPVTTIRYSVPKAAPVTIAVYDILGQKIRTLFSGTAAPGVHELQWNGRNDAGVQMSSGIYFYHLKGKDINLTRKMILMK